MLEKKRDKFARQLSSKNMDETYMRRCLELASCGFLNARPNPMVGAVIVYGGRIIGEGYHVRCGEAHAEVNAFASVKPEDEHLLPESTLYVSLEPCSHHGKTPPCADLIVRKGVKRVVVGCVDPFAQVQGRGIEKLRNAGMEVTVGVLEEECLWLNRRFITFHTQHRPYIILKWAETENGFLDDHFHPLAISSPFTKMLSHKLRAENDAILVGRVTDEREHPELNVREWSGRNPKRLVLGDGMKVDELLRSLYEESIQSLIVEGGRKTLQSFIDAGLWDEIRVETAPITVNNGTKSPLLPPDIRVAKRKSYDDRVIMTYERGEFSEFLSS